jgi:hypothetical protein
MAQTSPSKGMIVKSLIAAFDVIAGRVKVEQAFEFTASGFWYSIIASWGFGLFMSLPFAYLGTHFLALYSISSLVSLLLYALIVWHMLVFWQRGDKYLYFIIPFFWLYALQIVLFGLVTIIMFMTGIIFLQLAVLPVAIWILIWQFRIARSQLNLGFGAAIGLVLGRFGVDIFIGTIGGLQSSMMLG